MGIMIMIIDPNDTITGDNDQNPSETGSFLSKMFRAGVSVNVPIIQFGDFVASQWRISANTGLKTTNMVIWRCGGM
jgi:hypothetical protein